MAITIFSDTFVRKKYAPKSRTITANIPKTDLGKQIGVIRL
tara:strand:- start:460 stop:582 length:123 start_codon:yes stop_codon:yes gene_type:complete